MIVPTTEHLARTITRGAQQLEQDIDRGASRTPVLLEIRDLRRTLVTLERELVEEYPTNRGDAC
jgi:hypothetical protein